MRLLDKRHDGLVASLPAGQCQELTRVAKRLASMSCKEGRAQVFIFGNPTMSMGQIAVHLTLTTASYIMVWR